MNIETTIINKPVQNIDRNIKIISPQDILNVPDVQAIRNAIREHLLFIGMDNRNNVRNVSVLAIGSTSNIEIDTKEILRIALFSASDKVILVHNHPSNSLEPSSHDMHMTNTTKEILKPFNISLLDHIIVTEHDFISMQKERIIKEECDYEPINNMSKGLLEEENRKLKEEIKVLKEKLKIAKKTKNKKEMNLAV